jgi:hypothetical protein
MDSREIVRMMSTPAAFTTKTAVFIFRQNFCITFSQGKSLRTGINIAYLHLVGFV